MRHIEIILSLANVLTFIVLVIPLPRVVCWMRHSAPITLLIAFAQLLVEGQRWEMIPAYVLTALFFSIWLFRTAKAAGNPVNHKRKNSVVAGLAIGMVVLGLTVSIVLPSVLPVFRFPSPSGPYKIGTVTYNWTDVSRH